MITEGIIKTIDYNGNSCTVRIPLYETVQNLGEVILPGKIAILPGIFNGYKPDDMVWVAFEQDRPHKPIIIGKIFKSGAQESSVAGGAINCKSLVCSETANLPVATVLTGPAEYKTLKEVTSVVKKLEASLTGDIQTTLVPSRYYNCLIIQNTANTSTIKIYFETSLKYKTLTELLQVLSASCNKPAKLFPVVATSTTQASITGMYVTSTSEGETIIYKIYTQDDILLYQGAPGESIDWSVNDITKI